MLVGYAIFIILLHTGGEPVMFFEQGRTSVTLDMCLLPAALVDTDAGYEAVLHFSRITP